MPNLTTVWICTECGERMLVRSQSTTDVKCLLCGGKVRATHVQNSPVRGTGFSAEADLGFALLMEAQSNGSK
jgi:DNA-directed RNA polymerase subunit RPC12/RpoP